jgi:hypothetical protein
VSCERDYDDHEDVGQDCGGTLDERCWHDGHWQGRECPAGAPARGPSGRWHALA